MDKRDHVVACRIGLPPRRPLLTARRTVSSRSDDSLTVRTYAKTAVDCLTLILSGWRRVASGLFSIQNISNSNPIRE
ncbi:hypothetical protein EVAR_76238_1 [Eumeta japonica]|uniref:Uncharacterized protein n=1 Tax=Eumeta variegata TaxID=151549 RepID=A0A4C1UNU5_EUMVA|nr:hypothetical protein EVAR_76238_1 [Eumeta japonica]